MFNKMKKRKTKIWKRCCPIILAKFQYQMYYKVNLKNIYKKNQKRKEKKKKVRKDSTKLSLCEIKEKKRAEFKRKPSFKIRCNEKMAPKSLGLKNAL